MKKILGSLKQSISHFILSVPFRWKIIGIGIFPVIILGVSLNYWITTGLSDWLSYLLTDNRVEAAMNAGSRSVLFVTIIGAFFSVIILALLVHILNNPIDSLRNTAEEVAAGKYHTRATVWAKDEIGSLAMSVNQMIDNFVAIQENLSGTNQQLEILNKIALAADSGLEIHDVLYIALENTLKLLDLDYGWVHLFDPEIHKLHLASWKDVPENIQDYLVGTKESDLCDCLKDLTQGQLKAEIIVHTCTWLQASGLAGDKANHLTIPIQARNTQFGVISLYYPHPVEIDEEIYPILESLATRISETVANAWLQIKLSEKEAARVLLLESLVNAQEDERMHLARELHDQAGQSLTSLLIRLKTLEKSCADPDMISQLTELQNQVSDTIDNIRDLSYSLRPPALEEFGLGTAIQALAEDIAAQSPTQIHYVNHIKNNPSSKIDVVIYRIVQEGLTNVIRHAEATEVEIELELRENLLYLRVEDNGKGFDPADAVPEDGKRHLGLISMNERAELIGGVLEMYSSVGKGTKIEIKVPVPEMEFDHVK